MSDSPESTTPAQPVSVWKARAQRIKNALQVGMATYTYLRANYSKTAVTDRQVVTAELLTALSDIDLTSLEIAEVYSIVANAEIASVYELAVLDNLEALQNLSSDLQDDERTAFLAKFTILSAQAKAREDAAIRAAGDQAPPDQPLTGKKFKRK